VRRRLKRVMNPVVGLDLILTNLVEHIEVSDGVVQVDISLPEDHQFANNIRHEILEKLEHRWDVEEVVINFTGGAG